MDFVLHDKNIKNQKPLCKAQQIVSFTKMQGE